eukprot:gene4347-8655_t
MKWTSKLICSFILPFLKPIAPISHSLVADSHNYTCDELKRWLGTEKHYSNDLKDFFFGKMECQGGSVALYRSIRFHKINKKGKFASKPTLKCSLSDDYAAILLSNFSINNNYSHFLHALLRLFCALIDVRWIAWSDEAGAYIRLQDFSIWVDESLRIDSRKMEWLNLFGNKTRLLSTLSEGSCVQATNLLYGSGCVRLLPPEKWFGYPGCRAAEVLPAFGTFARQQMGLTATVQPLRSTRDRDHGKGGGSKRRGDGSGGGRAKRNVTVAVAAEEYGNGAIQVAFAVRTVGSQTGQRVISNLGAVQGALDKTLRLSHRIVNVSFEAMTATQTVSFMASTHIFVSVHGAGMTNTFFMRPGTVVVEIVPWPLCTCRSPDYFYGLSGFYHGSSLAAGLRHFAYCVEPASQINHQSQSKNNPNPNQGEGMGKCSWRSLHAVQAVNLDIPRIAALLRAAERELVAMRVVSLDSAIVTLNPHANG